MTEFFLTALRHNVIHFALKNKRNNQRTWNLAALLQLVRLLTKKHWKFMSPILTPKCPRAESPTSSWAYAELTQSVMPRRLSVHHSQIQRPTAASCACVWSIVFMVLRPLLINHKPTQKFNVLRPDLEAKAKATHRRGQGQGQGHKILSSRCPRGRGQSSRSPSLQFRLPSWTRVKTTSIKWSIACRHGRLQKFSN